MRLFGLENVTEGEFMLSDFQNVTEGEIMLSDFELKGVKIIQWSWLYR